MNSLQQPLVKHMKK